MSRPERTKDRHYSFSDVDEGSVLAFGGSRKRLNQQMDSLNKKEDPKIKKPHHNETTSSKAPHHSTANQRENANAKHEDSSVGSPSENLDITGKGDMKKDGPKGESIEEEIEGQFN